MKQTTKLLIFFTQKRLIEILITSQINVVLVLIKDKNLIYSNYASSQQT